jgi:hypothetical protein
MPSPPTESWFAIRIKGSFATQSPYQLTCTAAGAEDAPFCTRVKDGFASSPKTKTASHEQ